MPLEAPARLSTRAWPHSYGSSGTASAGDVDDFFQSSFGFVVSGLVQTIAQRAQDHSTPLAHESSKSLSANLTSVDPGVSITQRQLTNFDGPDRTSPGEDVTRYEEALTMLRSAAGLSPYVQAFSDMGLHTQSSRWSGISDSLLLGAESDNPQLSQSRIRGQFDASETYGGDLVRSDPQSEWWTAGYRHTPMGAPSIMGMTLPGITSTFNSAVDYSPGAGVLHAGSIAAWLTGTAAQVLTVASQITSKNAMILPGFGASVTADSMIITNALMSSPRWVDVPVGVGRPEGPSRFPLLAAAQREGRIDGSGLPAPGLRTLRLIEDEPDPATESEQIAFGRSTVFRDASPRRPPLV